MNMHIYFCKDGNLRLMHPKTSQMIPMTDVQKIINMEKDDFLFFSRFLLNIVHFEKGLTVNKFFKCLEPWSYFWSLYSQVELNEYLKICNTPQLLKNVPFINEVEFSHVVNIQSAISHIIDNKTVHNENLDKVLNSEHSVFVNPLLGDSFNISNEYFLRGYTDISKDLNIDISDFPFVDYMNSQFVLRNKNNVIFEEDGIKDIMDIQDKKLTNRNIEHIVFSKNMFDIGGKHIRMSEDLWDYSFSYIEGETFFEMGTLLREIFRHLPHQPILENTKYSNIFHEAINLVNEKIFTDDEDKANVLQSLINHIMTQKNEETYNEARKILAEKPDKPQKPVSLPTAQIIPFKQKNNKTSTVTKTPSDNGSAEVVHILNFKKKEDKGHIHQSSGEEYDYNVDIFNQIIGIAHKQGIPIQDGEKIVTNTPQYNRVQGIIQNEIFKELDMSEFYSDNFKPNPLFPEE